MSGRISLILTDLDGTLVDTRAANYHAYREVLADFGKSLTEEHYNSCFGLRLEEFLQTLDITDKHITEKIRKQKALVYPIHFDKLVPNNPLLAFLKASRRMGIPLAVVSTARRENILNVLKYIGAYDLFDLIVSGENVSKSKPDPECYIYAIRHFNIEPDKILIFEDTPIGIRAAIETGANCLVISDMFYGL